MAQGHTIPHLPVQKIVAVPQTVEAGLTALCLLQYRRVQREIFHSVQLGPCLQHQGGSIICGIWRAIAIFWYVLIFVNDHACAATPFYLVFQNVHPHSPRRPHAGQKCLPRPIARSCSDLRY